MLILVDVSNRGVQVRKVKKWRADLVSNVCCVANVQIDQAVVLLSSDFLYVVLKRFISYPPQCTDLSLESLRDDI